MRNDPAKIKEYLLQRKHQFLYRSPKISESAQSPLMQIDGKQYLTFCSNDYLGLANNSMLTAAFKQAATTYGVGSGAAHLINGHTREHHLLEEELAEFTGRDRALLFSNGYMANMGVINAIVERGDFLYQDRLNHASLIDAGLLSSAKMKRYAHNDVNALNKLFTKNGQLSEDSKHPNSMIVTDGVFSMDGDEAPVASLAKVAKQQDSWLMVDDAHGFGTLGEKGSGLLEQENLKQNDVPILMATLGKAVGTSGAFIAGSDDLIEYLIQTTRTYIYTTAMPASIAAATRASLKLLAEETWRREKLSFLIEKFRKGAAQLGIELMPSNTAIQPIMMGSAQRAMSVSKILEEQNILITAIRPPTVPEGSARLRVTFSANHNEDHVDILLEQLVKAIDKVIDKA